MNEDPAASLNAYWLALGKFIHCFSMLEVALQYALWNKSGVDGPSAQALFSGVRAREALTQYVHERITSSIESPVLHVTSLGGGMFVRAALKPKP